MKSLGLVPATLAMLLLVGLDAHAQSQREAAAAGSPDEETLEGRTLVIEVPPAGMETRLPLNLVNHTAVRFNTPVEILVDNLKGAIAERVGIYRVDIWPDAALALERGEPPVQRVPLAGNFSVESGDRVVVFEVYQPEDLANAVGVLHVRSPGPELLELRRRVVEAKDDVTRAEAARRLAEREALDAARARKAAEAEAVQATREAKKARDQARASRARARRETAQVRARAQADVEKANAEAARANKEAEEARAIAARALADAEAARAEAAAAREREEQAREAAKRQAEAAEQTLQQSLVAVARDIGGEQVQRLIPAQDAKYATHGRVQMEYRSADWKHGYFIVDTRMQAGPGRPIALAGAQATTKGGQALETRLVFPGAPENPANGVLATVRPGTAERITFAIKMPPDVAPGDLTLTLTQQGSQKPLNFLVPRYSDAAVALLLPISDAEEQRRRWATHIVAGPRFALGGCSLTSSSDGVADVEFTRCTSVGAFATKGLHDVGFGSLFAVGVEATYEWSDDARFDREPADITRKADMFRLVAHGDVRLSRGKSVPYLRLGGGLQYTNYGDGDSDFSGFYSLGGGFEYRLGDQFSIAAGAGYISASSLTGGTSTGAVEVNVRAGYRWGAKPAVGLIAPSN